MLSKSTQLTSRSQPHAQPHLKLDDESGELRPLRPQLTTHGAVAPSTDNGKENIVPAPSVDECGTQESDNGSFCFTEAELGDVSELIINGDAFSATPVMHDIKAQLTISAGDLECGVCLEIFELPATLSCGHTFCKGCITEIRSTGDGDSTCPNCRKRFDAVPEVSLIACVALQAFLATLPPDEYHKEIQRRFFMAGRALDVSRVRQLIAAGADVGGTFEHELDLSFNFDEQESRITTSLLGYAALQDAGVGEAAATLALELVKAGCPVKDDLGKVCLALTRHKATASKWREVIWAVFRRIEEMPVTERLQTLQADTPDTVMSFLISWGQDEDLCILALQLGASLKAPKSYGDRELYQTALDEGYQRLAVAIVEKMGRYKSEDEEAVMEAALEVHKKKWLQGWKQLLGKPLPPWKATFGTKLGARDKAQKGCEYHV